MLGTGQVCGVTLWWLLAFECVVCWMPVVICFVVRHHSSISFVNLLEFRLTDPAIYYLLCHQTISIHAGKDLRVRKKTSFTPFQAIHLTSITQLMLQRTTHVVVALQQGLLRSRLNGVLFRLQILQCRLLQNPDAPSLGIGCVSSHNLRACSP
jgi:hypothetical protein